MSELLDLVMVVGGGAFLWMNKDAILSGLQMGGGSGMWYRANGPTKAMPQARCSPNKCGESDANSGGNRWENNVDGFMAVGFEVVATFNIAKGSMCGSGGHIGLKHGGPNHKSPCLQLEGDCCCWWDSGLRHDGKVYMEIERPHPHNIKEKFFGSIGRTLDNGVPLSVRWHISKEGSGIRLMQWVDVTGRASNWRQTYNILDTGQFMPRDYYSKIPNTQNIEIRVSDVKCSDVKVNAVSRKIGGGIAPKSEPYMDGWSDQFGFLRHDQYFS